MDERPQSQGAERILDCQRPKAGPAGTFRGVLAEATRGSLAERIPRPVGRPIMGLRSPEGTLLWAMLCGRRNSLTTCAISKWWARKSAKRQFPYWMKSLPSHTNPLANWKSRPGIPSSFSATSSGACSTSSSRLKAPRKVPGSCFGRVILHF